MSDAKVIEAHAMSMVEACLAAIEHTGGCGGMVVLLRDDRSLGLLMTSWSGADRSMDEVRTIKDRTWELIGRWYRFGRADVVISVQDAWVVGGTKDMEAAKKIVPSEHPDRYEALQVLVMTDVTEEKLRATMKQIRYERTPEGLTHEVSSSQPTGQDRTTYAFVQGAVVDKTPRQLAQIKRDLAKLGHSLRLPVGQG